MFNYKIAFLVTVILLVAVVAGAVYLVIYYNNTLDQIDQRIQELKDKQEEQKVTPPPATPPATVTPPAPAPVPPPPTKQPEVVMIIPLAGKLLPNRVDIKGKAMSDWFFEANIVCKIVDDAGRQIAKAGCSATSDWMQPGYVTFEGTLFIRGAESTTPSTPKGNFIVENDNPSGDPAKVKQYKVLVRFE